MRVLAYDVVCDDPPPNRWGAAMRERVAGFQETFRAADDASGRVQASRYEEVFRYRDGKKRVRHSEYSVRELDPKVDSELIHIARKAWQSAEGSEVGRFEDQISGVKERWSRSGITTMISANDVNTLAREVASAKQGTNPVSSPVLAVSRPVIILSVIAACLAGSIIVYRVAGRHTRYR